MRRTIAIGKKEFESTKACIKECNKRIAKYKAGDSLSSKDFMFFKQLLAMHPDREEKIGCGIQSLRYDRHSSYSTKCLIITRYDGSEQPVSWFSCLCRPTIKHKVQRAFRAAAESHINLLKASVVFKHQKCFLSGEKLGLNNSRAVYNTDLSFNELVAEFLWCVGLDYKDVGLHYDNGLGRLAIEDETLIKKWQAFHEEMAVITLISSKPKIYRKGNQDRIVERLAYA